MFLERLSGLHSTYIDKHTIYTNFFAIAAVLIFVFAFNEIRRHKYPDGISWVKGIISGIVITTAVALLSPLSQWIIHTFITPDYFPNIIKYSTAEGILDAETAKQHFSLGSYIFQSSLFAMVSGVITSAIVALFFKKRVN